MSSEEIIAQLKYDHPFLFVDHVEDVNESGIRGSYTFDEDLYFYKGHFRDMPITPGVLLTECMAQIGVVCLAIYLVNDVERVQNSKIALTNTTIDFLAPSYPNDTIIVESKLLYFRFNKLKCNVKAMNMSGAIIAKGTISGIFKDMRDE